MLFMAAASILSVVASCVAGLGLVGGAYYLGRKDGVTALLTDVAKATPVVPEASAPKA